MELPGVCQAIFIIHIILVIFITAIVLLVALLVIGLVVPLKMFLIQEISP